MDLIDENVDCVIRGGQITDQSLVARHIGDLQAGIHASPAYLQQAGIPAHPQDLERSPHRVVGYLRSRSGTVLPYTLQRGDEQVTVKGHHLLAVDDGNAYLAAGVAGLGALWLLDYMAAPHVATGELVRLFPEWRIDAMPLHLAFPPNRHVSAKLRVFIDWIAALVEQRMPRACP